MEAGAVGSCAIGRSGVVGEFDSDIEEGIPYITGLHFTIAIAGLQVFDSATIYS